MLLRFCCKAQRYATTGSSFFIRFSSLSVESWFRRVIRECFDFSGHLNVILLKERGPIPREINNPDESRNCLLYWWHSRWLNFLMRNQRKIAINEFKISCLSDSKLCFVHAQTQRRATRIGNWQQRVLFQFSRNLNATYLREHRAIVSSAGVVGINWTFMRKWEGKFHFIRHVDGQTFWLRTERASVTLNYLSYEPIREQRIRVFATVSYTIYAFNKRRKTILHAELT